MKQLFSTLFLAFIFLTPFAQAQHLKQEWTLVRKEDGRVRHFRQGQKITVKWYGVSGLKTSKGKLVDIKPDSLLLKLDTYIGSIAKQDIEEIATKHRGWQYKAWSVLLFIAGFFIIGFFFLLQGLYNSTRIDVQLAAGEHKTYWPWSLLGIGVIALAFNSLKHHNQQTSKPFSEDWILKETPTKPNKMP